MTPERQKLLDRVAKLLALSRSDNQNEAELALAKANEMMQEHQIATSEIESDVERDEEYVQFPFAVAGTKVIWLVILAQACAMLYDGDVINVPYVKGKTTFVFISTPSNVELMKATFVYLHKVQQTTVISDLEKYRESWRDRVGANLTPGETMKFKHGHGVGFAYAIHDKVLDLIASRKNKLKQHSSSSNALVLVQEQKLSDFMGANAGKSSGNYSAGSSAGREAGRRVGERTPIESSSSPSIGQTRMIAK